MKTNRQNPRQKVKSRIAEKTGKAQRDLNAARRKERVAKMLAEREEVIADLRDQCVGEAFTSGLSDQQIHANGGPTPQTLRKWRMKQVRLPQLATARMLLRAVGKDLAVVDLIVNG